MLCVTESNADVELGTRTYVLHTRNLLWFCIELLDEEMDMDT